MLTVRAIKKFHDAKGILLGYTIMDVNTGQQMNVHKDQLKNAVKNNQCEIVNMTLTSDGRLIGKAAPEPKRRAPKKEVPKSSGIKLVEAYTNGRRLVGGLTNKEEFNARCGVTHPTQYKGLSLHHSFDEELELMNNISHNNYDNVKIVDGKPDMSNVKRKSFSKVKDKVIKMLKDNNVSFNIKVEKGTEKYEYVATIEGYDKFSDLEPMVQAVYCLVTDAAITNKIKVKYINEDSIYVENVTGIADVRKAFNKLLPK